MKAGWRGEEVGVVISIKAGVELWLKWVDPAGVDVPTTVVNPDAWRDRWIFKWVPNDAGVVVAFPNLDVVGYRWSRNLSWVPLPRQRKQRRSERRRRREWRRRRWRGKSRCATGFQRLKPIVKHEPSHVEKEQPTKAQQKCQHGQTRRTVDHEEQAWKQGWSILSRSFL